MGKYEKKETTNITDTLIPPSTFKIKITNTDTGETAEGVGYSKKEAEKSAWDKLKSKK